MNDVQAEMPRYKCHKEVHALKINHIEIIPNPLGLTHPIKLHFAEAGYSPKSMEKAWVEKHQPVAGGYYVVYEDGYSSFSPAKAFEEGYARI